MTATAHVEATYLSAGSASAEVVVNSALDVFDAHVERYAPDTAKALRIVEDFTGGMLTNSSPLVQSTSGTGASVALTGASEEGHPGIAVLDKGTTTTGSACIVSKSQSLVIFGADRWRLRCCFKIPVLSDGTDTFTVRIGFSDSTTADTPTNGAFLRYTHGTNSGKFECVTRASSTETATDSGVTALADTWYRLDIDVAADGSDVVFSLKEGTDDPVEVATNATNIPDTSSEPTGVSAGLKGSAGTNELELWLDLLDVSCVFGTAR